MSLADIAENYFKTMTPLAAKVHEDITEAKLAYEHMWDTLTDKEKMEIINDSIIKPEIALKYAHLESLEFDLNDPPVRGDDLMSFFGQNHGQRMVHDENCSWRDEHSAPFLYQTRSQLNLCVESERERRRRDDAGRRDASAGSPPPVLSELAMSHSKVVSELKNALKSHDLYKGHDSTEKQRVVSPTGFISKLIGTKLWSKEEDKQRLVGAAPARPAPRPAPCPAAVASSDNLFRTNFKSPPAEAKLDRDYRSSIIKSGSDISEEHRGLLSSASHSSSTAEFHSCEEPTPTHPTHTHHTHSTDTLTTLPSTGYDFLDNW